MLVPHELLASLITVAPFSASTNDSELSNSRSCKRNKVSVMSAI